MALLLPPAPRAVAEDVSDPMNADGKTLYAKTDICIYSWPASDKKTQKKASLGSSWKFFDYWHKVYAANGDDYYKLSGTEYLKASDLSEEMPKRCSGRLTYKLGSIDGHFRMEGFNQDRLLKMLRECEAQWESALGMDFIEYDPDSYNVIRFADYPSTTLDQDKDRWGVAYPKKLENGTIRAFSITVYDAPFLWAIKHNREHPSAERLDVAGLVRAIILHEIGHILGAAHEPKNQKAIMHPIVTKEDNPLLSPEDIDLVKSYCSGPAAH